ncbi:MAG: CubicO group peptidase (beta-lactamase class C family) [Arcticibacterium sp.]|jgi:CubicO group peptidase (beta-lactamase class C family)
MSKKSKTLGATVAILKDGKLIYQNTNGYRDLMTESLMKTEDIFRLYSMTKPITSVVIMML